ncbi:cytochrome P450 [Pholiota conissans]|uniref:Cytochrome P450 n=1 Tax=Pholiota conissans TaxID=109636 RepID=A0A9P5ZDT6_9AGAR|nr:cytochrome P450 [Pholiota conissans]
MHRSYLKINSVTIRCQEKQIVECFPPFHFNQSSLLASMDSLSGAMQFLRFENLDLWKITTALLLTFVLSRVHKLVSGLKAVNYMHGLRIPLQPFSIFGALLPTASWNPGVQFVWLWRHHLYEQFPNHSDTYSMVPFIYGEPSIFTSNLDVLKQLVGSGHKTEFVKTTVSLGNWGENLVTAEGEVWRKHRRIIGPAFNNDLYENVWSESLTLHKQMVSAEGCDGKEVIDIPAVQSLTSKFALLLIGKCGFGFNFDWSAPPKASDGRMSFQESLRILLDATMIIGFVPKWMQRLPLPKFKEIRMADAEMRNFMQAQIQKKKAEYRSKGDRVAFRGEDGVDVFTLLVGANEEEDGKFKLDDEELIGNVFIMLFAGHGRHLMNFGTTANTLAATLALLAIHQDIQQEILDQILGVVGADREPTASDYPKLDKVLASFYEALRMFPTAYVMIREATKDTILKVPTGPHNEETSIVPIPKGMKIMVDMVGIQNNPRYYEEPEKFRPSRWYHDTKNQELITAFGVGPRICIGKKFATTEAVCFLTLLLREWKVEPLLQTDETMASWSERVFRANLGMTLGITDVPIRLVRRKSM